MDVPRSFPWSYVFTHPLTKNAPLAALSRIAAWQIRSRLWSSHTIDWVRGQKLSVARGMTAATGNIYVGLFEFSEMIFTLHFLRNKDIYVDAGANVGVFTVLAAGGSKSRVIACEPVPATFNALLNNVQINSLGDAVELHQCALGASEATVYLTTQHDQKNHIVDKMDIGVVECQQHRLDDIVGVREPIMLKIDVEGNEENVLAGAMKTLEKDSLFVVQAEMVKINSKKERNNVLEILNDYGFYECYYYPFERVLGETPHRDIQTKNAFFVRNREYVEERIKSAEAIEIMGKKI